MIRVPPTLWGEKGESQRGKHQRYQCSREAKTLSLDWDHKVICVFAYCNVQREAEVKAGLWEPE